MYATFMSLKINQMEENNEDYKMYIKWEKKNKTDRRQKSHTREGRVEETWKFARAKVQKLNKILDSNFVER